MPQNAGTTPRLASNYGTVTPSDTVSFPDEVAGIYVGVAGNVALVKRDNTAVTLVGVPAGTFIPFCCIRVNSTNTTATSLVWFV